MRLRSITLTGASERKSTERSTRAARPTRADGGPSSREGIGTKLLLLAVAVLAVAYVVSRYVAGRTPEDVPLVEDVRERVPSTTAVREQTADAVPGEFQPIPIGERGDEDAGEATEGVEASTAGADEDVDVTEVVDDAETSVDMTDEERSATEISERADEDVPEPGEMAVDEDVAAELVDEGEDDSGTEDADESAVEDDEDDETEE